MLDFSKKDFFDKLKNARKSKFRSQELFCEVLGINRSRYARYETDTYPPLPTIYKISKILDVSIDYLLEPIISEDEIENPTQK